MSSSDEHLGFRGNFPEEVWDFWAAPTCVKGEKTDGMKTLYPYHCDLFGVAFI